MDGERIAGRVGARDGDALGDRSRALAASALPKLMFGFSSAIERAPSMSMSTAGARETGSLRWGGPPAHVAAAAVAEFRGRASHP